MYSEVLNNVIETISNTSRLEISASVISAISVWYSAKNKIITWPLGIIGGFLYSLLFWQEKLYSDSILQYFFIGTSIFGWIIWAARKNGEVRPIQKTPLHYLILFIMIAIIISLINGYLLYLHTDAYLPFIDSTIMAFSILAQLLLMTRRFEVWYIWLIVNTLAVPLYASKGIYLTTILFFIFWLNSWYGLIIWRKEMKEYSIL